MSSDAVAVVGDIVLTGALIIANELRERIHRHNEDLWRAVLRDSVTDSLGHYHFGFDDSGVVFWGTGWRGSR
jgi:hypothetical protein